MASHSTGSLEARENAAATLLNLSEIDQYKEIIGVEGAIPPLLLLLSKGSQKGKKVAVNALFNLCLYDGNKGRVVRAGVAPILMELLKEPEGVLMEETLSLLATLLSHPEWKLAIGKEQVVPVLVETISSGSPNNRENAAAILVELCYREQNYLVEAIEHGLKENLIDLLKHGTDRGKSKARNLLDKIEGHNHDMKDIGVGLPLEMDTNMLSELGVKMADRAEVEDPELKTSPWPFGSSVVQNMSTRILQVSKDLKCYIH